MQLEQQQALVQAVLALLPEQGREQVQAQERVQQLVLVQEEHYRHS